MSNKAKKRQILAIVKEVNEGGIRSLVIGDAKRSTLRSAEWCRARPTGVAGVSEDVPCLVAPGSRQMQIGYQCKYDAHRNMQFRA